MAALLWAWSQNPPNNLGETARINDMVQNDIHNVHAIIYIVHTGTSRAADTIGDLPEAYNGKKYGSLTGGCDLLFKTKTLFPPTP